MTIRSPLWARVVWGGLLFLSFFVPLNVLGIELRGNENCAPDIEWSDYEAARRLAVWTWAASLAVSAGAIFTAQRFAPSAFDPKPAWAAFAVWKAMSLALACLTSPSCFESNVDFEGRYSHPLENILAMVTILAWGLLIAVIFIGLLVGPKRVLSEG